MHRVAFETMGCRLNQAETAILQSRFLARGYTLARDPADADLFVLHTCTLTQQAAAKARRRLRQVIRRNPAACVAAIGCYAQTDAAELAGIAGVDYVVGTADKLRLDEIIATPAKQARATVLNGAATRSAFTVDGAGYDPLHTRANLKIQEGCDFACAFCIIPRSRGRARSREFSDLVREARTLAQQGHREIILTGVNIGTYRDDGRSLPDVIRALEDIDGVDRIRISSIEPTTIDDAIVDLMAGGGKLCPYLHVPVQSGDNTVLRAMRRRYSAGEYRDFMRGAMERVPGIAFGTDVIVGFPGEDERAFRRSCDLVMELPFVNLHVFSFSARPRTSACGMSTRIEPVEIRRRSDFLHRLAQSRREAVYQSMSGREVRVLFEARAADGGFSGFSDEYVRVRVRSRENLANQLRKVRLGDVELHPDGDRVTARGEVAPAARTVMEVPYAKSRHLDRSQQSGCGDDR
jgi:threonylcarbamoyladenosine tRNA methylthiotransferase MtaB